MHILPPPYPLRAHERRAFTLIELLVVIAIIAILAVVVVLTLNPAALLQQSRDSSRLSDMQTITSAINLYNTDQGGTTGYSLGTPGVTYISVPDPTATTTAGTNCSGLGLSGNYHCAASSTFRNVNGTGWLPVDLASTTGGSPLSVLPVDPINTTSSGEYYQYMTNGNTFEIAGIPESQKYTPQCANFAAGSSRTLIDLCQNIWVADLHNNRLEEFSSLTRTYKSQFGSSGSGNGQFTYPFGIAIDKNGNIWVVDNGNARVEEFSSAGTYESQFGSYGSGNGQFNSPEYIAIDASGNIWVVDWTNSRVEEFSSAGTYESQLGCPSGSCSPASGNGQFSHPNGIAIDANGNIWVTDTDNNRVEEFSASGTYESQFGSAGSGNGQFSLPYGIAIDKNGNIWVADWGNNRVEEFSASGTYESQIGSLGSGNGQFNGPEDIAIDAGGNVWVVDNGNARVEEFSASGTYESQFGSAGSGNGQFNGPFGIAIY